MPTQNTVVKVELVYSEVCVNCFNSDFVFFCVWTYVKSASLPFAQSFSHAKAQQWSDEMLP